MSNPDCATEHRAFIHERGGIERIAEVVNISSVKWTRVRDDISEAQITVSAQYCDAQARVLGAIEPGRHELVIYRGDERVWEGPITRVPYGREGLGIFARDVIHYLYGTAMASGYDNSGVNSTFVTTRAHTIITTEMTRKNVAEVGAGVPSANVLPYLVEHHDPADARTTAKTVPYQYTVFEHIDNLAADYGMDYTAVGRAIHLWDTHRSLSMTPVATEADFLGDFIVTSYGMELGTRTISTDGRGVWGDAGGVDPYYGLVERLTTAYDEETDEALPTQAELDSQALRALVGRNPTPVVLRVPENSGVNPRGVLTLENLIPGVFVPLRATTLIRNLSQMQKVDKVTVTEDANGEKILVSLVPAPQEEEIEP